jgi:predicted transcriptional regulator
MSEKHRPQLSPLETTVMNVLWERGAVTAEEVRIDLACKQPLKDSTVRTILRRLEEKGFAQHTVEGRTYVYSPRIHSHRVATDAVRGIIERYCRFRGRPPRGDGRWRDRLGGKAQRVGR